MGSGSKQKGAGGELEVARLIQPWWARVEPGVAFARTPGSGGWGKAPIKQGFEIFGDLMTTGVRFPFTVEVKRREEGSPRNFVQGKKTPVWGWWQQVQGDAALSKLEPVLFYRRNADRSLPAKLRKPIWIVVMRRAYFDLLRATCGSVAVGYPDFTWPDGVFAINGVDVGAHPVGYVADHFFAIAPSVFARSAA